MKLRLLFVLSVVPLVSLINIAGNSQSSPEFDLGLQAYKNARFEEASAHFKKAVTNDPTDVRARLYLATTFAEQYIPGAETTENTQNWRGCGGAV